MPESVSSGWSPGSVTEKELAMQEEWSFKQRFNLRASTMLLAFCITLAGIALTDPLYETFARSIPLFATIFWRFAISFKSYLLICLFLSMFFLGRTLLKKKPQVQFGLEIIITVALYIML